MKETLIIIFFTELVIIVGMSYLWGAIELYKRLYIPKSPFDEYIDNDEYEEEVFNPLNEELLDEGFIEEQNLFDSRISEVKETLKTSIYPPVEIITDEYEKNVER